MAGPRLRPWLLLSGAPVGEFVAIARHAEAAGFEGVAIGDHIAFPLEQQSAHPFAASNYAPTTPFLDPFVSITAMAAATTTLRFTTYIYVLPMRDPFSVAKQVCTAAMLSGYRVALGAGAGWLEEEIELLGHPARGRGERSDEMLTVIRRLWDSGTAEFHGTHFDFDPVSMYPLPQRPIPIYVGGTSRAALRRAVTRDGWLGPNSPVDRQVELLTILREERARLPAGDSDPDDFVCGPARRSDESLQRLAEAGARHFVAVIWGLSEYWTDAQRAEYFAAMTTFAGRLNEPSRAR